MITPPDTIRKYLLGPYIFHTFSLAQSCLSNMFQGLQTSSLSLFGHKNRPWHHLFHYFLPPARVVERQRRIGRVNQWDRRMGKPYLLLSSHVPRVGILPDVCQTEKPLKGTGGRGLKIVNYVTCRPIPALQAGLSCLALSHSPHHWCCNLSDNTCFKFINKQ